MAIVDGICCKIALLRTTFITTHDWRSEQPTDY